VLARLSATAVRDDAERAPEVQVLRTTLQLVLAGVGVRDRRLRQERQRRVVVDATVRPEDAAVAVARVFAEAHVGDERELRSAGADAAQRVGHRTERV